jgi:hypothetical protein
LTFGLSPAINEQVFWLPDNWIDYLSNFDDIIFNEQIAALPLIMGLCTMLLCTGVNRLMIRDSDKTWPSWGKLGKDLLAAAPGTAVLLLLFYLPGGFTWLLISFVMPLVLLWIFVSQREAEGNPFLGIARTFALLLPQWAKVWGLSLTLLSVSTFFLGLMHTGVVGFFLDVVNWVVDLPPKQMDKFGVIFFMAIQIFMTFFVFALLMVGSGLLYYTLSSMQDAGDLWDKIERIGEQRKIRGLERE